MTRRQAQRRGKALEKRVAETLDGLLHPGQAGDVLVLGADGTAWILEVKYRRGYLLDRKDQLGRWVEQAKGNAVRRGKGERWGIVLYEGWGTELLFLCPLAWAQDLFLGLSGIQEIVEGKDGNDGGNDGDELCGLAPDPSGGAGPDPIQAGPEGGADPVGDLAARGRKSKPEPQDPGAAGAGAGAWA